MASTCGPTFPEFVSGSATLTLPTQSTDWVPVVRGSTTYKVSLQTINPKWYRFGFSAPADSPYAADQVIGHHRFTVGITLPANFGAYLGQQSQAGGAVNATASTVFTVWQAANATPTTWNQVGTITFAAGTVTPTFATNGGNAITTSAGDVFRVVGPSSPDATFTSVYVSFVGYETNG